MCLTCMTAQKEHVILNVATMARTENRTVNYYQQRGILPPVGDHHRTNTSMVGAAVYMNMIMTITMIMMMTMMTLMMIMIK